MSTVIIEGTIPVYAIVDLEAKEVIQVVAEDSEFEYSTPEVNIFTEDWKEIPTDDPRHQEAFDIAEDTEWPAWDWGW